MCTGELVPLILGTKETKSIQTEGLSPLPLEAPACKLKIEYESEEHLGNELDKQRRNRNRVHNLALHRMGSKFTTALALTTNWLGWKGIRARFVPPPDVWE